MKIDAETVEGALGTRLFVQWLCKEISRDTLTKQSFPLFPACFRIESLVRGCLGKYHCFLKCVHCSFDKIMSGLSVEMLSSIASHLASQELKLRPSSGRYLPRSWEIYFKGKLNLTMTSLAWAICFPLYTI